jgi:hypothetical protein
MTATSLILLALAGEPAAAQPAEPAFGRKTTSDVSGIDPDGNVHAGDGAYGRFDGDLDIGLGVGPNIAFANGDLALGGRLSAHWFTIAGLYLYYAEALGEDPRVRRRFAGGLDLRPLFLLRWPKGLEAGPAILDLTIDSLSLGLGLATSTAADPALKSHSGFELSLGFGVPLAGIQPGPWLEFRAGFVLPKSELGDATALALFSWHFALGTPFVEGGE